MKAALCIGGKAPKAKKIKELLEGIDFIAAADSGFDFLHEMGVEPDLILGDMDSTRYREVIEKHYPHMVEYAPKEKDETDTEIGLRRLSERGANKIILIGGGGGRLDHLLGLVILFDRELRPDEWYSDTDWVISIDEPKSFTGYKGSTVSLFPAGPGRCRLWSRGLKWPLDELLWERGDAGISNEVVSEEFLLEPMEGRAILVCSTEVCTASSGVEGGRE